ncbi:glycosyltransferase family 2 protein [Sodalis ligni]|uniref:Putative LPLAT superfamily acyltransferase n=1 Tax=Sodalis ligni TaxID=2697027 RepID=A0A4R1NIP6_9GAMM|nr:glycosyltransferase family 2 protein [Sodalis ligni]TCL04060.1 putative LPLAT superfamily acyltransferase [Sodalis ligni]
MSINSGFSFCVIIPCYNHGATMPDVLARLAPFNLQVIIVDDGSSEPTRQILGQLAQGSREITLVRLAHNSGKGAAVVRGLKTAAEAGYSHALQIDADGQHRIEDIPRLLAEARLHPECLISGRPLYDASVPKSRLYGRYVTHVWVWIETLSLSIKDSMCGFRVYPIVPTLALSAKHAVGQHMDFDTEIMVRLYWQGTPSRFITTRVSYPANGVSHFDALWDNLRISWMHTRLFFGMLPRIPSLLRRRRHWSGMNERKGLLGMRFMLGVYRLLGRGVFNWMLRPVIAFYWLTGGVQRRASREWLRQIGRYARSQGTVLPSPLSSYRHFLRFGDAMLDKIASWRGDLRWGRDIDFAPGARDAIEASMQRGQLILASHLGDLEVCRAMAQQVSGVVINALVFTDHARRFKQLLEEIAPQAGVNLLPVNNIGPETAMLLKQKLDAGEWVAIVGDRTAVNPQRGGGRRVIWSSFLGRMAPFPQGPFVLAAALRCPVLLMFAIREQGKLRVYCERFADPIALPRAGRQAALQEAADRYALRLGHFALKAPLDWFNFFDFWHLPDEQRTTEQKE